MDFLWSILRILHLSGHGRAFPYLILQLIRDFLIVVPREDGLSRFDDHRLVDFKVGETSDVRNNFKFFIVRRQHTAQAGLDLANANGHSSYLGPKAILRDLHYVEL